MSDNKIKILQRLEAGEITAEEALAMISQIKDEHSAATPKPPFEGNGPNPNIEHNHETYDFESVNFGAHGKYQSHRDYEHQRSGDWIDGIVGWVGELVGDIADDIKDMEVPVNLPDIIRGSFSHNKRAETFVSEPILQNLTKLVIYGKNDNIEIYPYDGDRVQVNCAYDARRPDEYVHFQEENGCISLLFDEKLMHSVRAICQVPRTHIGQLYAATKNGTIHIMDTIADDIQIETKNDNIHVENITCKTLVAHNRNANIKSQAITGTEVILETSNAKITAEDIHAVSLTLKTSNANIRPSNLDVVHLYINTTNANLKLENLLPADGASFWENEHTLEASTTNGTVRFYIPNGIGLDIEANTTNGKVTSDVPLYNAENSVKARLKAQSMNYTTAGRKFKVILNTSNANVKIRER